jgi:hypothetical protein
MSGSTTQVHYHLDNHSMNPMHGGMCAQGAGGFGRGLMSGLMASMGGAMAFGLMGNMMGNMMGNPGYGFGFGSQYPRFY